MSVWSVILALLSLLGVAEQPQCSSALPSPPSPPPQHSCVDGSPQPWPLLSLIKVGGANTGSSTH